MNLQLWLAFLLLLAVLAATPGPAVFTVIGQAVGHGWRLAVWGAVGIEAANLVYFGLSALGVGAFLASSPRLVLALRVAGIGYLAFTSVRMLLARASAPGQVRAVAGRRRALLQQAVATQLGNPKAIIFFASLLTPFVDLQADWPVAAQLATYALTTVAVELPILVMYGWAAGRGSALLPQGRLGLWQDRLAGGCLLMVSAWLALRG